MNNELSETFLEIIKEIGLENAIKVAKIAGGGNLYIPKVDTIERPSRDKKIQEEFNGYNFRELSLKYNMSESTIRNICKPLIDKKRNEPMQGQLSLFNK